MTDRKVDVYLDIKTTETEDYTQAKDSTDDLLNYWYKFSGGDDGDGNVTATESGTKVKISIMPTDVCKQDFDLAQLQWKVAAPPDMIENKINKNKIVLDDLAILMGIYNYSVIVNPEGATSPDIYCDPRVSNTWGLNFWEFYSHTINYTGE